MDGNLNQASLDVPGRSAQAEIAILLTVYQGVRHLQAQLDSFVAQTHNNWSLIISDDGSDDGSAAIVADFRATHHERDITCHNGPRAGYARNFLSLLERVPKDTQFAMLSDHDDVWFPDKLTRAVEMLSKVPPGVPALYSAATLVCDEALNEIGPTQAFPRAPAFRNALVQSIGGGNTMVLNRAALGIVTLAAAEAGELVAHDWWLYQIITGCGGRVLRDPDPVLYYRQHACNAIGANTTQRARASRISALLGGRFRDWNRVNMAALTASAHRFTPEAQQVLADFTVARRGGLVARLKALRASGVWRQNRSGTIALYIACILRRL